MLYKSAVFFIICFFTLMNVFYSKEKTNDWPVLKGPYLGQKPPGLTPEIFAPGIISTNDDELCSGFMNNGTMFIFSRMRPDSDWRNKPTFIMELKNGKWTKPVKVSFQNLYPYNFTVAPDDKTLYFTSEYRGTNIWKVTKTVEGWSDLEILDPPINTDNSDFYPSVTKDSTIYFVSTRNVDKNKSFIYRSKSVEGKYTKVENIGIHFKTKQDDTDPFIAPDESYLIFLSRSADGFGDWDLCIIFRNKNGSWTEPINMGKQVNTAGEESRPSLTPDGKFFFFCSDKSGNKDIYWVDASIIENLKELHLK